MARRVQGTDRQRAEFKLPPVVKRLVVIVGLRVPVDVNRGAGGGSQPAVPGDVVGMVMGLQHMLNADPHVASEIQILVGLKPRIDDGGHPGLLIANQIRRTAEIIVRDLSKDHLLSSSWGSAATDVN